MTIDKDFFDIEPDEDDGMSVLSLNKHLEQNTELKKNITLFEIEEMGEKYLKEIEKKKKNKSFKSKKLIPYILRYCDDKYDEEELQSYSYEDIQDIYEEIKIKRRPAIIKFFHFIFNLS